MHKPLATALASAFVAVAIVIGCSSPSPDEGPSQRGRTSGPTEKDPMLEAGDTKASCEGHATVSDIPTCDTCTRAKCCDHVLECDENPDCVEVMKCLDECGEDDIFCGLTCQLAHEKGAELLSSVGGCAKQKCAAECPAVIPDAGDFADVF